MCSGPQRKPNVWWLWGLSFTVTYGHFGSTSTGSPESTEVLRLQNKREPIISKNTKKNQTWGPDGVEPRCVYD